jgi:hypothetical protein
MTERAQIVLSQQQVAAFYHTDFVEDQTRDFVKLLPHEADSGVTVDVGGGCGFFARRLAQVTGRRVRVLDRDPVSVLACTEAGVEAVEGDALAPAMSGDERIASFNLVLHHLVASSEKATRALQVQALLVWRGQVEHVFVNEYIYESFLGRMSGWLIYQITSSRILSALGRAVATVVPSFRANTFGVGVRFRAHREWRELFEEAGYTVDSSTTGASERVSAPLRLLLIKTISRDSYLLTPKTV